MGRAEAKGVGRGVVQAGEADGGQDGVVGQRGAGWVRIERTRELKAVEYTPVISSARSV